MNGHRKIELANFNCTFGDDNEPMLEYFSEIIYPAISSGKRIKNEGKEYLIEELRLYEIDGVGYVLAGLFIMKTELEVKSIYSEDKGIQATDYKYKSDPYSAFVILLKNHRMIYIKNQKGSPTIKSFAGIIRRIINDYVRSKNTEREKDNKLPYAFINVTNIPSNQTIDQQFKDIEKIKKVTFKLYPLNGDMEFIKIFDSFRNELSDVGSKTGNMNINSPKNKREVSKLIKGAGDKVDTKMETVLLNGVEKRFTNNDFSEIVPIYLPEEETDIHENIRFAIHNVSGKNSLKNTSKENQKIYGAFLEKIHQVRDLIKF